MRRDGPYRRRSVLVRLEIVGDLNLRNGMISHGALGDGKPRLSRIEAMYRQTRRQDSRNCGLLASAGSLRSWHANLARAVELKGGVFWERPI